MKIGDFKVKLNYNLSKGIIDFFSLCILYFIYDATDNTIYGVFDSATSWLKVKYENQDIPLYEWGFTFVFPLLAFIVLSVTLYLTFKRKKLPKRYIITEKNAQQYSDIYTDALAFIRFFVLLSVFEMSFLYYQAVVKLQQDYFSMIILMNAFLIFAIIRFSFFRLRKIARKKDDSYVSNKK